MKQIGCYFDSGNDEAEGGASPQLSRNCDGNERRDCHWAEKPFEPVHEATDFAKARDMALDRWADMLSKNIDMEFVQRLLQ